MKRYLAALLLVLRMCYLTSANANYVLVVGNSDTGVVDVMDMNSSGTLSPRTTFDIWKDAPHFYEPRGVVISPKGHYAFFSEFYVQYGVLYSIDDKYHFKYIAEIPKQPWGASFTADDKYMFFSSNIDDYPPTGPRMNIVEFEDTTITKVFSECVPTSLVLTNNPCYTPKRELISTTRHGPGLKDYIASYKFDDETGPKLVMTDSVSTSGTIYSYVSPSGDFLATHSSDLMVSYKKDESGKWVRTSSYWGDLSDRNWSNYSIWGVVITPDGKFAVYILGSGFVVFSITPDKTLQYLSFNQALGAYDLTMTPDGHYFVIQYNRGQPSMPLGVYRLNKMTGAMEKVSSYDRKNWTAGMAFLPQALPPAAANNACALYDSARSGKSVTQKPTSAETLIHIDGSKQRQRIESKPSGSDEWHRVEIKSQK